MLALAFAGVSIFTNTATAQTTITTAATGNVNYDGANYVDGNGCVSFAVENTNSYAIILNGIQDYKSAVTPYYPLNNGKFYLWSSATSLSDTTTITTTSWTLLDSVISPSLTNGYNTIFSSLNLTIPSKTTYRFALQSTNGIAFSGGIIIGAPWTTPIIASPSILSKNGVNLLLGNAKIGGYDVGFAGSFPSLQTNNSWFTGAISFSSTIACTTPPVPGNTVASSTTVCKGVNFGLQISGNSFSAGQNYQWQISDNGSSWTNITGATEADITTSQNSSKYYRCSVTCSGNTSYSTPVQITTAAGVSGNYTINQVLPASSTNFLSFASAISHISCGINGPVVFEVSAGSGPYQEQVLIPSIGGTSATNTITFNGNGESIVYQSASTSNRPVLTLNGADHIIIDSLNIDCSQGVYGWGILFTNQADSNIVRNCTIITDSTSIVSSNHYGIIFNGSASQIQTSGNNGSYNLIEKNTINGGEYGINLWGLGLKNTSNTVSNNIIENFYKYGVTAAYQTNVKISGNNIYRPGRTNSANLVSGIFTSTGCLAANVEKNRVHNLFDAMTGVGGTCDAIFTGAAAEAGQENRITNNLVYNMNGSASMFGIVCMKNSYTQVLHNTVVIDDPLGYNSESYGLWQLGSAGITNVNFANNLVYMARGGTGARNCINFNPIVSLTSNHNAFYSNCPNSNDSNFAVYGTLKFATLADWKNANNNAYDQLSVAADPLFVNTSSHDYIPSAAALNDIGATVGVATDILGTGRGDHPDPGAYEFTIPACSSSVVAGTAIATKTNTCPGYSFVLDLNGNNFGAGQTYQWQSSTDNINWTNIGISSTAPQYITSQASTNYYRCMVQCSAANTAYSAATQVITPAAMSGIYTINNAVSTGGNNFNSFNDALNAMRCGINGPVVFNIATGSSPYNEHLSIPNIPGTSGTNTITFNGNGAILTDSLTDQNFPAGVILNGADDIIFDSLTIDVSRGNYAWGILFTNQADSNIIKRCTILTKTTSTNNYSMGIVFNGGITGGLDKSGNNGNHNTITDNIIIGGYQSIYMYGNKNSTTQNVYNVVKRNKLQDMYAAGVFASQMPAGLEISENDISRPTRTNSGTYTGIYLYPGCAGALVEKNRIHDLFNSMLSTAAGAYGFYINANPPVGQENKVINNAIYNLTGAGSRYGFYLSSSTNNCKIYHNSFAFDDQTAAAASASVYGLYANSQVSGVDFRNNLISLESTTPTTKNCITIGNAASSIISNNNILFIASPGANIGVFAGTPYDKLITWKTANSNAYDQSSVSADPMFTNVATGDLKPTNSLVDNIGAAVGVTDDIAGIIRSSGLPDAGAYEFGVILPVTQLNLGGEVVKKINKLHWTTTSETNNKGFVVMRSNNINNKFEAIGFVASKAQNGSGTTSHTYTFDDVAGNHAITYYKLKQVELDGRFYFSNTIALKNTGSAQPEIISLYPNPSSKEISLSINAVNYSAVIITVTDIYGKTVLQQSFELSMGNNSKKLNIEHLAAGIYAVRMNDGQVYKLIKL